jgi:hypothetical protein
MTRRTYEKPTLVKRDALPLTTAVKSETISDRRLKADIVRVGMLRLGIPLFSFRYFWSDDVYVGVMAQDVLPVRPDAITTDASGFMQVDYGRLGTRMMTLSEWEESTVSAAA